jgi:hypothetical protein
MIYCTSFCNQGHDLQTGRPINHECIVLPPKALQAERDGDFNKAIEIIEAQRRQNGSTKR